MRKIVRVIPPVSAAAAVLGRRRAREALPKKVGRDQVAEVFDKLVAAGLADRQGDDEWVLRAKGSEAWLRLSLRGSDG